MEDWDYQQDGAVEGPVTAAQLKALREAGKITAQTLVRRRAAGGEWKRYGAAIDPQIPDIRLKIPRAVEKYWPWFVFGTPLVAGLSDVFLVQSQGHEFVESNGSWLGHAPLAINILALVAWLAAIWIEVQRSARENKFSGMIVWIIAAPLYQAASWWATALVSALINISLGFGMPGCQADIVKAEVMNLFAKAAAKLGEAEGSATALVDAQEQLRTDRMRICTANLETSSRGAYSIRYKIEDHGGALFRNTLHGLTINMSVIDAPKTGGD